MSAPTCTWKGCALSAHYPQIDGQGVPWANLCQAHRDELESVAGVDAKAHVSAWIKAMGGAEKAIDRFGPAIDVGDKALQGLAPGTAVAKAGARSLFAGILRKLEAGGKP